MRRPWLVLLLILLGANVAHAYEFKLQFTPRGGAQGLIVAGYQFNGSTVVGNCSYYVVSPAGGKGGHSTTTHYYNTCTWDLYGNLISLTPVSNAPVAPAPISTTGTEIIYALSGSNSTGRDTRGFGFVNTPSSHYTWKTVNGGYAGIPYAVYTIAVNLISDGDFSLDFDAANVSSFISGYITPAPGTATVSGTTCSAAVPVGTTCSVTISYDPTTIKCTSDAYGFAYTGIDLSLVTDSGTNPNWTVRFTVSGVPICDD